METKIKALLIIMLINLFSSCKDGKSVDELNVIKSEVEDNLYRVSLKVIVKKQDDFALFYTEDGSVNFFGIKPLWVAVNGSETEQDVNFILPEGVYPNQLRFDLGLKENQENIIIKGLKVTYKDQIFETYGSDFFNYFRADENQCKVNQSTGEVISNIENGKRKVPSIYPHQDILGKKLENLGK